ncbi:hypothetical protein L1F30_16920 [Simiduia sp. 21SJ11W-1]|uniref:hypothetical protein n=1 Tax=Simiduia sp. 21SJ11W-1 TaxID=2909669 RepID=UPI0020A0D0DF|nr:hypothetical protein [Simiduia sp. 21SJ11W-1]UTA47824.1 hypothetical protein L1F30_16920 [Simiduia sp. 21SJ11W-1]
MKRFYSKKDPLLAGIIGLAVLAAPASLLAVPASDTGFWIALAISTASCLLCASMFLATYYEVDGNQLRVRCHCCPIV